ncbi:protein CHUP1, chloroplastic-like [Gossypium australe]|uniref:Protein CHUP1, chloroplastic-like n=1 Tax=Gossypium australe TaxID=47621 RepID=A0A5B6ULC3_9ROSI|nr:protein CHUP1, chloroplastic-like [Gossypium australe]
MSMQRTSVDASVDLSPSNKHGEDVFLLPEFSDNVGTSLKLQTETARLELDTSTTSRSAEKDDYEQEIKYLRNMVRMLSERERNLELQLLEYYGLKEQEAAVFELQNQLKINKMEAKLFNHKIESLQSENQRLEAQVVDHARVMAELETAKSKIKLFKKKLKQEAEQNREQILSLQKKVARFQEQELKVSANNQDAESNLQRVKALEIEGDELRKFNMRLQMENSELSHKLQSTQILANSVFDHSEVEALNEMSNHLREENQALTKQIEQLRAEKFTDVEELVYLRWINACLRYELKNYQPLAGRTVARDLSKGLSPRSEEKAKKLVLEYAKADGGIGDKGIINHMDFDCDQWFHSSSQTSFATDDSSCDNSSSASKPTNKIKFFKKLRRLLRGKDNTSKAEEDADSPTSNCSSVDIPRWRSLNLDQTKEAEKFRRNSDFSSYGFKRLISGKDDDLESPVEPPRLYQDADSILKFAEVLKQPTPAKGKIPKKAASIM